MTPRCLGHAPDYECSRPPADGLFCAECAEENRRELRRLDYQMEKRMRDIDRCGWNPK